MKHLDFILEDNGEPRRASKHQRDTGENESGKDELDALCRIGLGSGGLGKGGDHRSTSQVHVQQSPVFKQGLTSMMAQSRF